MAFEAFLQVQNIKGDSTDLTHQEWIEILAFSHGITQPDSPVSQSPAAGFGECSSHADFTVLKRVDLASPQLFLHCCNAKPIGEIKVQLCRSIGEMAMFMEYTMKDVIVSRVRASGSTNGEDMTPLEEVCFHYSEVHLSYTPSDADTGCRTGESVKAAWSTLENQAI